MTPKNSFASIITSILSGLEQGVFNTALAVLAVFAPALVSLSEHALTIIGDNFRKFLDDVGKGTPWGTALADMMTADWNEVEEDGKQAAIDFAEAVATALENMGLIPQGK